MGSPAFKPRYDRYRVSPEDQAGVYLVGLNGQKRMVNATLINVSESGCLCRIPKTEEIEVGEYFLFEFKSPGRQDTIAWKGKVVRVQWMPLGLDVGIQFIDMPKVLVKALRKGIQSRLHDLAAEKLTNDFFSPRLARKIKDYILVLFAVTLVTWGLIYLASRPEFRELPEFVKMKKQGQLFPNKSE